MFIKKEITPEECKKIQNDQNKLENLSLCGIYVSCATKCVIKYPNVINNIKLIRNYS